MHNTDFGTLNQDPLEEARYVEEMKSRLDSLYLKLTFARQGFKMFTIDPITLLC